MQARLELNRFPTMFIAILFALAVTLLLGGVVGYALKPAAVVSGPTHIVVLPAAQPVPSDDPCAHITHGNVC